MKFSWYQSIYIGEHFIYKHIEYVKISKYVCKRVDGLGSVDGYVLHHDTVVFPIRSL